MIRNVGLPVFEFRRGRWFASETIRCAVDWIRLVRSRQVELVHTFDYYTNLFAAPLARISRVPLLVTSRRDTGSMFSAKQRWALRRVFLNSDRIVVNSEAARQSLLTEGLPDSQIRMVRNGVDLGRYQPNGDRQSARERFAWNPEVPVIAVIANLRPEKGHKILLRAVPAVLQKYPRAHFVFAGPGPLESELRAHVAANDLSNNISFLGDCDAIPELLAALDIVVLPSTSESFPNVVLEAMSAGRPVITSAVGGCTELIDHDRTGLLFPSGDSNTLAQRILRLLGDPLLSARLATAGRGRAEREFNFARAVKNLEDVYDELLDGRQTT